MRPRRLTTFVVAAAVAATGCAAPPLTATERDGAAPSPTEPAPAVATPAHHEPRSAEIALCTVLPPQIVGDLIGADDAIDVSGDGSQCTWRGPGSTPGGQSSSDGPDLAAADGTTLQGAILDVGSFEAGRPPADDPAVHSVTDLAGVGDEAYVVRLAGGAPTTLYVRDGDRALSLWIDGHGEQAPADTERSLQRVASLVLNLA